MAGGPDVPNALEVEDSLGGLLPDDGESPLAGGQWYVAGETGAGLRYAVPPGSLAATSYLTTDLLLDGRQLAVFQLTLHEAAPDVAPGAEATPADDPQGGRVFVLTFGLLNQCTARMRLPLTVTDQERWMLEREGAFLKPLCWGDPVDVERVDRIELRLHRRGTDAVRWCMSPLTVTASPPDRLDRPGLPKGPLVDELGQSTLHDWPARTRDAEELTERLVRQADAAPQVRWPDTFSRWGGAAGRQLEATGFFRTEHDGRRWWLVDPDGHPFWSSGVNCVHGVVDASCRSLEPALSWLPEADGEYADAVGPGWSGGDSLVVNFLGTNLIRAFGPARWQAAWGDLALATLREAGFNTVANWSDWELARAAGFPYARPLDPSWTHAPQVYRDFPDVFDPAFAADAAQMAEQLRPTLGDPAMVGYFLMNEPTWGFATETPAAGMLRNGTDCLARRELASFLEERHGGDAGLAAAWGGKVTLTAISEGPWHHPLNEVAERDLADFSSIMVAKLYGGLSEACRAVDAAHLNLGARYYTVPPAWALAGMRCFDVFSMNCYRERVPETELAAVSEALGCPVLIGEWHFGALDAGLPASGIGHVADQEARGQAFRIYLEDAAAKPWCVGAHYFTLYDQSALGRFDGENYNIGFVDVCHRPYAPLVAAARESHARMYEVGSGAQQPYADEPDYLPRLYL